MKLRCLNREESNNLHNSLFKLGFSVEMLMAEAGRRIFEVIIDEIFDLEDNILVKKGF